MKHKLESRLLGEISTTSDADDTTFIAESEEGLKSLLMKVKEESGKSCLKIQQSKNKSGIQSHHFMGKRWRKMETVTDFIFLSSKITVNSDCFHKTKTLAPWKESFDKHRQHIKKQKHSYKRNILPTKICKIKTMFCCLFICLFVCLFSQ